MSKWIQPKQCTPLIIATLHRYFRVDEFVPFGGAVAYPILTHNSRLFSFADPQDREHSGQFVLDRDANIFRTPIRACSRTLRRSRRRRSSPITRSSPRRREKDEDAEKNERLRMPGQYYDRTLFSELYWELACLQTANGDLQRELETIPGKLSLLQPHEGSGRLPRSPDAAIQDCPLAQGETRTDPTRPRRPRSSPAI